MASVLLVLTVTLPFEPIVWLLVAVQPLLPVAVTVYVPVPKLLTVEPVPTWVLLLFTQT